MSFLYPKAANNIQGPNMTGSKSGCSPICRRELASTDICKLPEAYAISCLVQAPTKRKQRRETCSAKQKMCQEIGCWGNQQRTRNWKRRTRQAPLANDTKDRGVFVNQQIEEQEQRNLLSKTTTKCGILLQTMQQSRPMVPYLMLVPMMVATRIQQLRKMDKTSKASETGMLIVAITPQIKSWMKGGCFYPFCSLLCPFSTKKNTFKHSEYYS